jgi:hypothetical protein
MYMTQGTGTMKKALILLTLINSVYAQSLPIAPVSVDCRYAAAMSIDLEKIIANPSNSTKQWDNLFATIAGSQTNQQRISSAKVVLWSIRTNCPGF